MLWLNLHWLAVLYETGPAASAWYPARGLSLALVLLGGLRFIPVLVLASLIGGVDYHLPHHPENLVINALLIAAGMGGAAWILQRLPVSAAMRLRDAVALILVSALAELVVAYGVVAINIRSGLVPPQEYWGVAFQFFVGDYLGILIVVPVAMLAVAAWPPRLSLRRLALIEPALLLQQGLELLLIGGIAGGLLWLGLSDGPYNASKLSRWYLLLLPVSLAAIRFGLKGAAVLTLLLSAGIVAVVRTTGNPVAQLDLQLLLLSLCVVGLLLSAAVSDRQRSLKVLAALHRGQAERARREAEQARLSKARFLAATTHDLRPPFEAVRLGLETLALHKLPQELEAVLQRTRLASQSLSRVLENVLDTARIEGEIRGVRPRVLALGPLLAQLAHEMNQGPAEHRVPVRARPSELHVIGDIVLLERVLRNLVSNAVRACRPSGRVLLGARRRGLMARLEVHDTGSGIASDKLSSIFEDFSSGAPGGVGIGLSLVREISDRLGLNLQVCSQPGRGTVFTIELPLAANTPRAGDAFQETVSCIGDRIIALATRDAVRNEILSSVLSNWGAAVVSGWKPEGVLQELRALDSPAHLLLVDPGAGGADIDPRLVARVAELPASATVSGQGRPLSSDLEVMIRSLR